MPDSASPPLERRDGAGEALEESRFQRIGVVAKPELEAMRVAGELGEWLRRRQMEVHLDARTLAQVGNGATGCFDPSGDYDLVVALGGDGTLLGVARRLSGDTPLLGVNLGNLGFLTEVGRTELYPTLVKVLSGDFELEERSLLQVTVFPREGSPQRFQAFNDAVIAKGARSRIVELNLSVDQHPVARYRADGMIISTPTGSTAYNLSAGGPILFPQLPATVLAPICPHTLSLRPMVVPSSACIEVVLETRDEEVFVTVDGQEGTTLAYHDRVQITRSRSCIHLVKTADRTFYDSLRGKLRWGGLSSEPARKS